MRISLTHLMLMHQCIYVNVPDKTMYVYTYMLFFRMGRRSGPSVGHVAWCSTDDPCVVCDPRDCARGADSAPLNVKLYINRQSMGFSDTDDMEPAQTLELTPADLVAGSASVLKFVKFQRVTGLSVSPGFGFLLAARGAAVFVKESAQPRY